MVAGKGILLLPALLPFLFDVMTLVCF